MGAPPSLVVTLVLVVLVVGCAKRPGQGVTPRFAVEWDCRYSEVMERAEEYRARIARDRVYIPQIGWDACELMARRGRPDRINRQTAAGYQGATWRYGSGQNLTMVSLEVRGGRWTVTYVGR